jgi:hypothetical protein
MLMTNLKPQERKAKMTDIKLTKEEQETIIKGNAASQGWEIVTADPRMIRRMEKQGYSPDKRENPWGYTSYTIPFAKVRIGKAVTSKRGKPFSGHANLRVKKDQTEMEMV